MLGEGVCKSAVHHCQAVCSIRGVVSWLLVSCPRRTTACMRDSAMHGSHRSQPRPRLHPPSLVAGPTVPGSFTLQLCLYPLRPSGQRQPASSLQTRPPLFLPQLPHSSHSSHTADFRAAPPSAVPTGPHSCVPPPSPIPHTPTPHTRNCSCCMQARIPPAHAPCPPCCNAHPHPTQPTPPAAPDNVPFRPHPSPCPCPCPPPLPSDTAPRPRPSPAPLSHQPEPDQVFGKHSTLHPTRGFPQCMPRRSSPSTHTPAAPAGTPSRRPIRRS